MTSATPRARLVEAAFAAFEERGYDQTTADEIAARAGVGRTTFFRAFRTKDEVVFPDHERILTLVEARLREADPAQAHDAAREAAVLVLRHYVDEGDLARSRYRLTSTIPALRDREVANVSRYQRLLYEHFRRNGEDGRDPLDAELLAAAWVTVHNHVLRKWLRGASDAPEAELRRALDDVMARLGSSREQLTTVAVFRTTRPLEAVLPALQEVMLVNG